MSMATPSLLALGRRTLLTGGAASGLALAITGTAQGDSGRRRRPVIAPFTLGVASGDPGPTSVVLWTRLAPDPFAAGGGMPARPVLVQWDVSENESFRNPTRRGVELAWPQAAHSVHATVPGLDPDRHYWYRFKAGRELSPVGRTRTTPSRWPNSRGLRIAMVSCQDWQDGFYTAYRHVDSPGDSSAAQRSVQPVASVEGAELGGSGDDFARPRGLPRRTRRAIATTSGCPVWRHRGDLTERDRRRFAAEVVNALRPILEPAV
jgi:hypothetical protein